ncbi:hypothetical protein AGABI2DRAFT_119092 [Agaricus bisporus var. bisporus H97]|uniref:hypothetical protein n=1 Tax=Agaricus bisporus var. bisporus (strain H97 / ATCC MYA-4626 / FGSC 10389) TaxID=936046 RepID=UPI00029F659A|nr:hypothetical protein AGABI2DRAFT_119092 [Agaricus bisporus var. bisporus H97]EKV46916.1 hypothetical protein AGABI2DRAFT_119092 [Agaricus bisporus var. bisporus H97]
MDSSIPITFPFPLQNNDDADLYERVAFWDSPSTLEWFRQRGYTLYEHNDLARDQPWYSEPTLSCPLSCEMHYPYPHYEAEGDTKTPFRAFDASAIFAQETQSPSHHVAIKLIVTDSEEHRILKFLQSQGMEVMKENCLFPILDILWNGAFCFAIMPRWGGVVHLPTGGPTRNVIHLMHSLLKALVFLHEHNILHRDIKFDNILVSHFADDAKLYGDSPVRQRLRYSNQLNYCLFDFDISMMLPADTDRARCRFPYKLSWDGTGWQPRDTSQGEFDYNPFAYDVGTLGRVLCTEYQHLTPQIPMLAPFLDRMVTRNIPMRFNAMQALQFFEVLVVDIPGKVMDLEYASGPDAGYDTCDRWEGLPPDFIKKWEDYREPPIPFSTSVLRWICSFDRMCYIVPPVRHFFFRIASIPSRISLFLRNLWSLPHPS